MPDGYGFAYMIGAQVLFFVVTIGLVVWFVKNIKERETVKDILDKRLVSGEINTKEYDLLMEKINEEV